MSDPASRWAGRWARRWAGRRTRRGWWLLPATLLLALVTTACTAGPADDAGSETPAATDEAADGSTDEDSTERLPRVSTPVTRVAGRLSEADRLSLRRNVEALLRRYAEKGLLDPGADAETALRVFTPGARRLATGQRTVMWGLAGRKAEVRAHRLEGTVSAFAPGGKAQGATLRLDVALDVTRGDRTRRVRLTGRMLLTPAGGTWRVFGFDVGRSDR
jgi:hypothetical protein